MIYAGLSKERQGMYIEGVCPYDSDKVMIAVSEVLEVSIKDIKSLSRKTELVFARQAAMFLIRKSNKTITLKSIGKIFNRDHSTVIYAIRSMTDHIKIEKKTKSIIQLIQDKI